MAEPPVNCTDAVAMREELDYEDMVALSGMSRRWAIYEADFTPEQRTGLIAWSADFEHWRLELVKAGEQPTCLKASVHD